MRVIGVAASIVGLSLGLASAQDRTAPNLPPNPNLFQSFAGQWGWEGSKDCDDNPHSITFSIDQTRATIAYKKPIAGFAGPPASSYTYRVLFAEENKITMSLEGETRRTGNGDRVVWVLIHLDQNSYAWRATHWESTGTTKRVVRCSQ